jgi:hypothetical protein
LRDRLANTAVTVLLDLKVNRDLKVHPALQEHLGNPERPVPKVHPDRRVLKVIRA